jgi:hypothetical protein
MAFMKIQLLCVLISAILICLYFLLLLSLIASLWKLIYHKKILLYPLQKHFIRILKKSHKDTCFIRRERPYLPKTILLKNSIVSKQKPQVGYKYIFGYYLKFQYVIIIFTNSYPHTDRAILHRIFCL